MNFTCTYTQSEKLLREFYYNVKMKGVRKWLWLGILLIAGSCAMFIYTKDPIDLLFLVLGVYFGIKELIDPYRAAKKDYDALLGKYGLEIPQTTVTIDEEKAVRTFDGQETTLLLDDVLGLYFCKNCIVLHGYSEDVILAGVADPEEYKKFLNEHCKNAPVYKR